MQTGSLHTVSPIGLRRLKLQLTCYYSAPDRGAEYCDESVCLSIYLCVCVCVCACVRACVCVCVSLSVHEQFSETTQRIFTNFLCMLPVAVARSSSGGVVTRYGFLYYGWRHICSLSKVAGRRRLCEAQCTRSLGLGYKLCAVIPIAGQRTHGTTFRALKVISQVTTPGGSLRSMTALFSLCYFIFVIHCRPTSIYLVLFSSYYHLSVKKKAQKS